MGSSIYFQSRWGVLMAIFCRLLSIIIGSQTPNIFLQTINSLEQLRKLSFCLLFAVRATAIGWMDVTGGHAGIFSLSVDWLALGGFSFCKAWMLSLNSLLSLKLFDIEDKLLQINTAFSQACILGMNRAVVDHRRRRFFIFLLNFANFEAIIEPIHDLPCQLLHSFFLVHQLTQHQFLKSYKLCSNLLNLLMEILMLWFSMVMTLSFSLDIATGFLQLAVDIGRNWRVDLRLIRNLHLTQSALKIKTMNWMISQMSFLFLQLMIKKSWGIMIFGLIDNPETSAKFAAFGRSLWMVFVRTRTASIFTLATCAILWNNLKLSPTISTIPHFYAPWQWVINKYLRIGSGKRKERWEKL